ncbi:hypothetical protein G6011_00726 [Alternaria panax]|uniref:Essential protein Yae1 N-terminal domain-containing protein n=1 Tax=Alternaria panax TaxID=48097 RepID=A0AAD4IJG5_9PLEO|nr:hypothetical protein G6011_00726 [Alternaria panax]
MPMMPISGRLQVLLDRAREANEMEHNRVSLESFLAGLHQEDKDLNDAQLKQFQASRPLAIYQTLLGLVEVTDSVPQTAQVSAVTASRAMQTDAATISLWDLLPKARNEAYDRGLNAGKDEGYIQGLKEGEGTGMAEGLAIGLKNGQAGGLKLRSKQGKEVEMQHGIELGRRAGYSDGLVEGVKQTKEKMTKLGEEHTRKHEHQKEAIQEKIVVKLPPTLATAILKKSNKEVIKPKPKSNGVDPFASLLGLVHKK